MCAGNTSKQLKIMAKSFLVIACVCYCTICMHLAAIVLATTKMENEQSKFDVDTINVASIIHTNHRQPNILIENSHEMTHTQKRHRRMAKPSIGQKNNFVTAQSDDFNADDVSMKSRIKRHTVEHHDNDGIELNRNAQIFVRKLFQQFGNGEQETMNVTGFEQMLQHLGLHRLIEDFSHKNETQPKSSSDSGFLDSAKHVVNTNETVKI